MPQFFVKQRIRRGGQRRPPLQDDRPKRVVGADDPVGPENAANPPKIFVKAVHPARADVGIGPYGSFVDPLRRGAIPQALRASSLYTREPLECTAGGAVEMSYNLSVSFADSSPGRGAFSERKKPPRVRGTRGGGVSVLPEFC